MTYTVHVEHVYIDWFKLFLHWAPFCFHNNRAPISAHLLIFFVSSHCISLQWVLDNINVARFCPGTFLHACVCVVINCMRKNAPAWKFKPSLLLTTLCPVKFVHTKNYLHLHCSQKSSVGQVWVIGVIYYELSLLIW